MNAITVLKLMEKYKNCPDCGNGQIGNGEGALVVEETTFTRKCKCGFKITLNENGQEINK